jgi:hypothetical protein
MGRRGNVLTHPNEGYVWYASYGSNLLRDRFLCYILGGIPEGAKKHNTGTPDKSLPLEDRPILIPNPLYFSERSDSWQGAGVAFISPQTEEGPKTMGRMYLITPEQFIGVVRQENGLEPEDELLQVPLDDIQQQGEAIIGESWYGRIVYLGNEKGFPIYTFTTPKSIHDVLPTTPGENYLRTIGRGLIETYGLTTEEVADYFLAKPGVQGIWSRERLLAAL